MDVLHQVIQKAIEEGTDERLKAEAIQLGEGWMHVNGQYFTICKTFIELQPDDRNLPEMGRISSPDDIIASVRVEGGEVRDPFAKSSREGIILLTGVTDIDAARNLQPNASI